MTDILKEAFSFFHNQLIVKPPLPRFNHSGKTIIITGSNTGLGLEAARHFVRLNARKVILAVRNIDKGEIAKQSIEETTKPSGVIEVWQLDLTSYESVKQFAARAQDLERLDVLVENAAIETNVFRLAEDNEATITTNVISTFLLGLLLLPKLRATAQNFRTTPHLSIVSSENHAWFPFPEKDSPEIFEALSNKETADMKIRYPVSKLLQVFITRELAALHAASGNKLDRPHIIINYLTPGFCHSDLRREPPHSTSRFLAVFNFLFARTTEVGSRTLVHAANAGPESHGQFLNTCQVTKPGKLVRSEEGKIVQKRIWNELSRKLEAIQPGVMSNV